MARRTLPLTDVRVVDASGAIGAYASRLLSGMGADVLVVERPGGDPLRTAPPFRTATGRPADGLLFAFYHPGQRSLVLDVDDDASLPALRHHSREADVVLVSPTRRDGANGFDPIRGRVDWAPDDAVVCSISPFGLTGPYRHWRATPFVSYAMCGDMHRVGPADGPPIALPARIAWDEVGAHAVICVLAALLARNEVGGQFIELAVHDVLCAKDFRIESYSVSGKPVGGRGVGVGLPPTGTWECADGRIDIGAHQVAHWDAFLEMLGRPDELCEPALADPVVRRELFDGLNEVIAGLLASEQREDLVARGQAVGLPCAVWNTPREFVADEQLAARDALLAVDDPALGAIVLPGRPIASAPPMFTLDRRAPTLGEGADGGWRSERVPARALARPLAGVRVLSLGAFVAGNTSAMPLAELGADVVKIEARARPEVLRTAAYATGRIATEPSGVTNTVLYAGLSRGTRGLSLDLHTAGGRDLFHRLVGVADVVIENFGSAEELTKWGCGPDELMERKADLVVLSLSGYGRSGPRSAYRAYGTNISAFTGLSTVWNHTHGTLTDYLCSVHGVVGILGALAIVARTGCGVVIDAAQIETAAAVMSLVLLEPLVGGCDATVPGNDVAGSVFSGVVRCAGDDRWIAVELVDVDDWHALCALLDRADLMVLEADASATRDDRLTSALSEWAAARSPHTCARLLQDAGIAAGAVHDIEDVARCPSLRSRGMVVEVDQPDLGVIEYAQSPYHMEKTPGAVRRPGPRLGEHTAVVLEEWLGMDHDEVDELVRDGAVFVA